MVRLLGLLATIIAGATAWPRGAPGSVCDTLVPGHGTAPQDNANSPYLVTVATNTLTSGATLEVTVRGSTNFKGFMIQVQDSSGGLVGSFEDIGDSAKLRDCSTSGKYVTHTGPAAKEMVKVTWRAPEQLAGVVTVYATVVQDKNTFWVKLPSPGITVSIGETSPSQPEPEPESELAGGSEVFPEHYKQCGKQSSCFGFGKTPQDNGCIESGNCEFFASWIKQPGDKLLFTLERRGQGYVALGFSDDSLMGEEPVLVCSSEGGEWYWNEGKQQPQKKDEDIAEKKVTNEDGKLRCKIETNMIFEIGDKPVDFTKEVVPLLAGGAYSGLPSYHNENKLACSDKILLTNVGVCGAKSDILMRLHGLFMVVAWLGFAGTGMLFARYFRQTWVGKPIGGKDRWFQAHRVLMSSTVFFSLMGLLFVAIEKSGFEPIAQGGAHPVLGLITLLFAITNPIMALFRPHPGTTHRPIFNWAHWAVGNSAHLLAVVTIFLASKVYSPLQSSNSTAWSYLVLVYTIIHVAVHIILSFLGARGAQKTKVSNGTPMNEMTESSIGSVKEVVSMDAPNSKHRKLLLLGYILAATIIIIVLISAIFKAF